MNNVCCLQSPKTNIPTLENILWSNNLHLFKSLRLWKSLNPLMTGYKREVISKRSAFNAVHIVWPFWHKVRTTNTCSVLHLPLFQFATRSWHSCSGYKRVYLWTNTSTDQAVVIVLASSSGASASPKFKAQPAWAVLFCADCCVCSNIHSIAKPIAVVGKILCGVMCLFEQMQQLVQNTHFAKVFITLL